MPGQQRIYLDHNASSPLRPEAREAMLRVMAMPGNPSSIHAEGRALKAEIERARKSVARLVGAEPTQVFFTSGATEAANWVLRHANVGALATEHSCIRENVARIEPVDAAGLPMPATDPAATAIHYANSETGVIVGMRGQFLCDAVQAVGRVPVETNARFVILAAHKIGGPKGVGALVARDPDAMPEPLTKGGGHERRQRAGTENAAGIAGFGAAAEAALRDLDDMPRIRTMRDGLEAGLDGISARHGAALHVFGASEERLPNTSCFAIEGLDAQTALMSLDLEGFAVSSGSACSSGKVGPSHVLDAMGVEENVALCALRVSLGWSSAEEDVSAFLAAYEGILARRLKRAA